MSGLVGRFWEKVARMAIARAPGLRQKLGEEWMSHQTPSSLTSEERISRASATIIRNLEKRKSDGQRNAALIGIISGIATVSIDRYFRKQHESQSYLETDIDDQTSVNNKANKP